MKAFALFLSEFDKVVFCFFKNYGGVRCLTNIMSVLDPSDGDDEDAKD